MKKRMGACLMALVMAAGILAAQPGAVEAAQGQRYGLTVSSDGTILLEGKPFYGFGVNLYTSFLKHLENPLNETYKEEFALMKRYNIPFVRIPFSGYQANYYDQFDEDPEVLFHYMDDVVAEAERQQVGIIASLMWWDPALSAHVGEKRAAMGDAGSKTMAYAKKYVAAIVQRYAGRPGIWGWEIGNEYNLTADLCDRGLKNYLWPDGLSSMPIEPSGFNYYTTAELQVFYREIAKEIRKYDSYRMISNGNGDMRSASKAMHDASSRLNTKTHLWDIDWTEDSFDDFQYMNAYLTPAPMDTICFHLQHGTLNGDPPQYMLEMRRWGKTVSSLDYFKGYVAAAKKAKKGLYFGEMGDFIDMETAADLPEKFGQVLDWVVESGIQIASTWQFGGSPENLVASDVGREGMKLNGMSARNLAFRQAGKQDLSKAWSDVKAATTTARPQTKAPGKPTSATKGKTATIAGTTSRVKSKTTPATAVNGGTTATGSGDSRPAVDTYMVSVSTKLTIDAAADAIVLEAPVTLDVFTRSVRLRDGYRLQVFDTEQAEITNAQALVQDGCAVQVTDPQGAELRRFTVQVTAKPAGGGTAAATTATGRIDGSPKGGLPAWALALIIAGIVLLLGGAGAGVYFGYYRNRRQPKG